MNRARFREFPFSRTFEKESSGFSFQLEFSWSDDASLASYCAAFSRPRLPAAVTAAADEVRDELHDRNEGDDAQQYSQHVSSWLLAVPRIAVTGSSGFFAADVCAGLRVAVPAHPLLVVDAAIRVEPNDHISRTMRLRGTFAAEELERPDPDRCARRRLMLRRGCCDRRKEKREPGDHGAESFEHRRIGRRHRGLRGVIARAPAGTTARAKAMRLGTIFMWHPFRLRHFAECVSGDATCQLTCPAG